MARIYKITNIINGKCYIGKTENSIEHRLRDHLKEMKLPKYKERPLYRAINKYGIKNFKIELLEETDIPNEREKYYIQLYNSYNKGYNATLGGDGVSTLNYQCIVDCYKKEKTIYKTAEKMGCDKGSVRRALLSCGISPTPSKEIIGQRVHQYTLDGEYIQSFSSYRQAAIWLIKNKYSTASIENSGGIANSVNRSANKKRENAYGFKWTIMPL